MLHKHPQAFTINNFTEFRIQMLNWANRFNIFCFLDNMNYHFEATAFECLLAAGCKRKITASAGNAFAQLQHFYQEEEGWLFGHFGYDLKNETEQLHSRNFDGVGCSDMLFFEPRVVVSLSETTVSIYTDEDAAIIFKEILLCGNKIVSSIQTAVSVRSRITKEEYIATVKKIQQHIVRGDCYEINFCQEFFAEQALVDPFFIYDKLTSLSPNPFSALYRAEDKWCLCASPERYLKKTGSRIISQPIKGTAKRNLQDHEQDIIQKELLLQSEKEKSENVMVVDLVRNDLSKVCKEGTVKVEELFGIYSFPQVHQMISTISGELPEDIDWVEVIKRTFPMGSMTGVPKKKVMELIEEYEQTKRGLFSGAIGYIDPAGDFDFNVVIRSMLYNATTKYLSFQTGGAITFNSDAEKEYEESLLKAEAMLKVLE
jgi:para-aminobenzoate synthetase component 1